MNDNEEQRIKNSILTWIRYQPVRGFAWSQYNGAVYDAKIKRYRMRGPFARKGVPDIIGIWCRKPLFIEVKTKVGKLSEFQETFLEQAKLHGAIAFVARSYDQAIKELEAYEISNPLPQSQGLYNAP